MPGLQRTHVIDSVMRELQAFLDAVEAFDAAITGHFGLERGDLRGSPSSPKPEQA